MKTLIIAAGALGLLMLVAAAAILWQRAADEDKTDRWCPDNDSVEMCAATESVCEIGPVQCSRRSEVWCLDERDGMRICFGSLRACDAACVGPTCGSRCKRR